MSGVIAAIFMALLLVGCGQVGEYVEKAHATTVEFNDKVLRDAIVLLCDAPSAGALRRRWGDEPEMMTKWAAFCSVPPQQAPAIVFMAPTQ